MQSGWEWACGWRATIPGSQGCWDDLPTSGRGWQNHETSAPRWKIETMLLRHYSHLSLNWGAYKQLNSNHTALNSNPPALPPFPSLPPTHFRKVTDTVQCQNEGPHLLLLVELSRLRCCGLSSQQCQHLRTIIRPTCQMKKLRPDLIIWPKSC